MKRIPDYLFVSSCDGALHDTRVPNWSAQRPLREVYQRSFPTIETVAQFKATLRNGAYAWPGGYPLYFVCSDGAALCFKCARQEARNVIDDIQDDRRGNGRHTYSWRVVGCEINYEEHDLTCDHCSKRIESAYGED